MPLLLFLFFILILNRLRILFLILWFIWRKEQNGPFAKEQEVGILEFVEVYCCKNYNEDCCVN
jgi:hypothetical protein